MAEEQPVATPPVGTSALRRTMSIARASAAAAPGAPALPPDQSSSPWAGAMPPEPDNTTTERAQIARNARRAPDLTPLPSALPGSPPRPKKALPQSGGHLRQAWALVERLLEKWSEESIANVGKANIQLSRRLAKDGVTLLREGIPMGSVADLIRLCNELARVSQGDGEEEDDRIIKMREMLHREIPELGPDPEPEADEGEETDGA